MYLTILCPYFLCKFKQVASNSIALKRQGKHRIVEVFDSECWNERKWKRREKMKITLCPSFPIHIDFFLPNATKSDRKSSIFFPPFLPFSCIIIMIIITGGGGRREKRRWNFLTFVSETAKWRATHFIMTLSSWMRKMFGWSVYTAHFPKQSIGYAVCTTAFLYLHCCCEKWT